MKRKRLWIGLGVMVILVLLGILWYKMPVDLLDVDSEKVEKIVIFNGNTGRETEITDREEIDKIINDLNSVKLQREKFSVLYMGYSFDTTIYMSNGKAVKGWKNFIINSEKTIRNDPFFYSVVEGSIDYEYLESLVE